MSYFLRAIVGEQSNAKTALITAIFSLLLCYRMQKDFSSNEIFLLEVAVSHLRVHLFKNGRSEFLSLLRESGIEFSEWRSSSGLVTNSYETIEISKAGKDSSPFGALAVVLVTWLRGRASREVSVRTNQRTVLQIEGYSVKEVSKILEKAFSITAIQTDKDGE
jgi:hypothetical protein